MSTNLEEQAEARQKLISEGSLPRTFFSLAGPAVASMSVQFVLSLANMIWVGRIGGPVPIAIVISSMFTIWIAWSILNFLTTGTVAIISRHFGAKEFDQAGYVASQSLAFSLAVAVGMTVVGVVGAPLAFKIMETSPAVTAGGIVYMRIIFAGSVMFTLAEVFGAVFRAGGDTRTPMIVSLIAICTNIILDPLLIFGVGPFPRMGPSGAALASVISATLGVAVYVAFIRQGRLPFQLAPPLRARLDLRLSWRIVKIGFPLSVSGVLFAIVYFFINRIASHYGDETVAAMGIGNRCEAISYLLCFGASLATATLVGQNLGAGRPERSEKAAWLAVYYTMLFTGLVSVVFFLFPEWISRMFISDARVDAIVKSYLRILGLSQIFMAAEIVLEGAFSGAGDTLPPMLVSIVWSAARIPLAYLLCFTLGIGSSGIWWTITLTSVIKGVIIMVWFRAGKWKSKKV